MQSNSRSDTQQETVIPPRELRAVSGAFTASLFFLLTWIAAGLLFLPFLGLYFWGTTGWTGPVLIAMVALALNYVLGRFFENGGWLFGICLAITFLFVALPWLLHGKFNDYIWTMGRDFEQGYVAGVFVLILCPVLGYAGSLLARKSRRRFRFKNMYISLAPIAVISLALAISTPYMLEISSGTTGGLVTSKKGGFQVKIPRGFKQPGVLQESIPGTVMRMGNWSSGYQQSEITIAYRTKESLMQDDKLPESACSTAQAYYDELVSREKDKILKYEYVTVDGRRGLHVWTKGLPSPYNGTIYIWTPAGVYSIHFFFTEPTEIIHPSPEEATKQYREVVSSFKFIPLTNKPATGNDIQSIRSM